MTTVVVLHARNMKEALSYREEFPRARYVLQYAPKSSPKSYYIRKSWLLNLLDYKGIKEIRTISLHKAYVDRYGHYCYTSFERLVKRMAVEGIFTIVKKKLEADNKVYNFVVVNKIDD